MCCYRVYFLDAKDNCQNEKLVVAECVNDIYEYMHGLGHYVLRIEEA